VPGQFAPGDGGGVGITKGVGEDSTSVTVAVGDGEAVGGGKVAVATFCGTRAVGFATLTPHPASTAASVRLAAPAKTMWRNALWIRINTGITFIRPPLVAFDWLVGAKSCALSNPHGYCNWQEHNIPCPYRKSATSF
jgi:hypothetical protein